MMHIRSLAVAALMVVHAAALIAFDGTACNGVQGGNALCNGTCFGYTGRQSFIASTNGNLTPHCVSLFTGANCDGTRYDFTDQQLQCTVSILSDDARSLGLSRTQAVLGCAAPRSARCFAGNTCL